MQFLCGVKTSGVQLRFRWVMAFEFTEEFGLAVITPSASHNFVVLHIKEMHTSNSSRFIERIVSIFVSSSN